MTEIHHNYLENPESDDDDELDEEALEKKKQEREKIKDEKKTDLAQEIAKILKDIEEDSKETPKIDGELIDTNPELETEAPVEHLSEAEIADISRSMAQERIDQIDLDLGSTEDEAATRFLDEVVATGDIDAAISESLINPFGLPDQEINLNKPEANGLESKEITISHSTPAEKANKAPSIFEDIIIPDIPKFLSKRREARVDSRVEQKKVSKKLEEEVDKLRLKLMESERRVRVEAANTVEDRADIPKNERAILEQLTGGDAKLETKIEKPVQMMKKAELIKVAEKIKIDGTTLKKIFENQLITEKGLRRIVSTFLIGGNVKRALNREIMERQIDFERDPLLRDGDGGGDGSSSSGGGSSGGKSNDKVTELLEKKGINFSSQDIAFIPKNSIPKKNKNIIKKAKKNPSIIIDIIMVLSLTGLLILLIFLLYKKR